MANTNNPRGFKPYGGGHILTRGTLAGTVSKGDPLSLQAAGTFQLFDATADQRPFAIANEAGVSGDEIGIIYIRPGDVFAVQSNLTYAKASHAFHEYDIAGTTGATYLGTGTTYQHCRIIGVHPDSSVGAPDASGAYCNVLVEFVLTPADRMSGRMVAMRKLTATLSGAYTISEVLAYNVLALDPGGAGRNVTLPTAFEGRVLWIFNTADAAEALTVKDSGGTTIGTLGQNEAALFTATDAGWTALGFSIAAI